MDRILCGKSWENYWQSVRHTHQRWLSAQQDMFRTWTAAWHSGMAGEGEAMNRHLDGGLTAGMALVQAQADAQRDLMLLAEKALAEFHARMLSSWQPADHPPLDAVRAAMRVGQVSSTAVSRMSRQVGHFAATNLSQATLNATRQMQRALHPSRRGK
ncbi:hypothetical protein [Paludibacterium paludis]|uniref:Phasin protein n=1 Tax=Paludibacterium paludis TaxID=1225769 RepID=A0A918NYM9_9NEIS|nr:hypothetical protein [Paludibacterium paludis]GGY06196.1 hypothetical protein GCM10011289_05810 [Paludibacterium paludis]